MPVLVSDTSVIVDLDRGRVLEDLFRLPFEFAVPDLLFHRELVGDLGDRLIGLGLQVEELTPTELARATAVRRVHKQLSTPDAFAFAIAERRGWPLLCGDRGVRRLAAECQVAVHGVLWVCDQFEDGQSVPVDRLRKALTVISAHPRCCLPVAEVRTRLDRYAIKVR